MIIKNKEQLCKNSFKKRIVLDILEAGIERVLPQNVLNKSVFFDKTNKILKVEEEEFKIKGRIFVIGGGKASGRMAKSLEEIIGYENIEDGVVLSKTSDYKTNRIKIIESGHPLPDERGIEGTIEMLSLKNKYNITDKDIIICLISGGGSALMVSPLEGITLQDQQKTTDLLINCGAKIHQINSVRKHLSKIKGGRLGEYFSPAKIISLIISDVVGNDLDVIASGPTSPDPSTFKDAYSVIEEYQLEEEIPCNVIKILKMGIKGEIEETPKLLNNCNNYIIADNNMALEAMVEEAEKNNLKPFIITSVEQGDTNIVSQQRASEIMEGKYKEYDILFLGGETTPKPTQDSGKGGRNQHFAAISGCMLGRFKKDWVVACLSTDGADYLDDIAGAIVDRHTFRKIKPIPYIQRFDTYNLFNKAGNSLILTGNTGTNVCDIVVYLIK